MLSIIAVIENQTKRNRVMEIYHTYYGTMFSVAFAILRNREAAEDAVSDAMMKIIHHIDKICAPSCHQLKGYVIVIVRNVALNLLEKQTKQVDMNAEAEGWLENIPDSHLSILDRLILAESCERITQAIDSLPSKLSDVLRLSVTGYSHAEISELLGVSYDAVKMRLLRARQAVKKILEEGDAYGGQKRKNI